MRTSLLIRSSFFLVALGLVGCAPERVAVQHPRVGFEAPPGVVLYLRGGQGALRVAFEGGVGLAPRVCSRFEGQVRPEPVTDSLRHLLRGIALRPGHLPAKLLDAAGRPIGQGGLCIFPTLRTTQADVLDRYRIRLDAEGIARLKAGQRTAWFQAYQASDNAQPG